MIGGLNFINAYDRGIMQASLTSKILRGVFQLRGVFWFFGLGGYFPKRREKSEVRFLAYLGLNLTKLRLIKLN